MAMVTLPLLGPRQKKSLKTVQRQCNHGHVKAMRSAVLCALGPRGNLASGQHGGGVRLVVGQLISVRRYVGYTKRPRRDTKQRGIAGVFCFNK